MSSLEHSEVFQLLQFILQIAVIPLIAILWKLNGTISDLKVIMYKEFVTKEEMEARFAQHKENSHA